MIDENNKDSDCRCQGMIEQHGWSKQKYINIKHNIIMSGLWGAKQVDFQDSVNRWSYNKSKWSKKKRVREKTPLNVATTLCLQRPRALYALLAN